MIFERALRREFSQAAAGISVALLAILTSTQLIRLLNDAAGGRIAPEAVMALLGFAALNYMPVLLTLTLFVSVLISLSRGWRDSEMVVWLSCGRALTDWIRPVLKFALPMVVAIALLAALLTPWANLKSNEYKKKLGARNDASQVVPGSFRESQGGEKVFFVEAMSDDVSKISNIFVASMQQGKLGVVLATKGSQEFADNGDRFIVLEQGRRYEVEPGMPAFKVMEFERYAIRTEDDVVQPVDRMPSRLPIWELISEPSRQNQAELLWRLGVPASAIVLALLAIPLSFVNPRAGRSANMLIAILIYAIYSNLLSISQSWVAQARIPFWLGVWAVHALMLLPVFWLFYRRMRIRMPWQRKAAA